MNWFTRMFGGGRPHEAKASRVAALLSLGFVGRPVWTERDFEKLAKEGYQRNVVAYRCVKLVAGSVATLPFVAQRTGAGGKKTEVESSGVIDLLDHPNQEEPDGVAFREAWVSFLLISGNSYTEAVTGLPSAPPELYNWRPDRVKVVPGADGYPEAWEYRAQGEVRRIEAGTGDKPVLHVREFHPLSDWYGMPALDPSAFALDTHTNAAAWNKSLIDNAARPPGAFAFKGDPESGNMLGEEQAAQLQRDIDENFSGSRNAGKPLLLTGGLEWQAMGFSPVEMDFIAGKADAARDICRAFGVPPMLIGIPGDNTYSNYQEARQALYEETVIPLGRRMIRAFGAWLGPRLGEGDLRFDVDEDSVTALAPRRTERWSQVQGADFLQVNEKREAVGYDHVDNGDVILVSSSMVPLEDAGVRVQGGGAPGAPDQPGNPTGGGASPNGDVPPARPGNPGTGAAGAGDGAGARR